MRCIDVNVLVYAHRPESPRHDSWRTWLGDARRSTEPLARSAAVASGFVRIVTHRRIFADPTPLATALDVVESIRLSPAFLPIEPGPGHWPIFSRLCEQTAATGNRVPVAALAALAIEHGATFVTADRGFARYPGLRLDHPVRATKLTTSH